MAAPTETEQKNKVIGCVLNPINTTSQSSHSFSTECFNPPKVQDYVMDFLENEVGNDLKSLKKVGDLLENLREENNVLDGQVT